MAARKNAKAQKSNELDGAEFFAAIALIEKEKGIPKSYKMCIRDRGGDQKGKSKPEEEPRHPAAPQCPGRQR